MERSFYQLLREQIEMNAIATIATVVAADKPLQEFLGEKFLLKGSEPVCFPHLNDTLVQALDMTKFPNALHQPQIVRHHLKVGALDPSWVDFFLEPLTSPQELIIFGGGHISLPLAQLGKMIGFHVTVVDDRPFFANQNRFPQADKIVCLPFFQAVEELPVGQNTFITIVTRGHQHDQTCLQGVIEKGAAYVGMIGSKSRVRKIKDHFISQGYAQKAIEGVYSPIGLDIGAETPEEIAISIIAQIISLRKKLNSFDKAILDAVINPELRDIRKTLVTIVRRRGSAPRGVGAKMLVLENGACFGTIGGGCVEADVRATALDAMHVGKPLLYHFDLTSDIAGEEGMVCGGNIDVFIEPVQD